MRPTTIAIAIASIVVAVAPSARAQTPPSAPPAAWTPIGAQATYLTGDTWTEGATTFRLYGVQACLRRTFFTNAHGLKRDCGEASAAMLVSLVRGLNPACNTVARQAETKTDFVVCAATLATGANAGSRIDLGTALIATGFAWAALTPDGKPVHQPYFVAQMVAQKTRAGLWQFADTPDPNALILQTLRNAAAGAAPRRNPPLARAKRFIRLFTRPRRRRATLFALWRPRPAPFASLSERQNPRRTSRQRTRPRTTGRPTADRRPLRTLPNARASRPRQAGSKTPSPI